MLRSAAKPSPTFMPLSQNAYRDRPKGGGGQVRHRTDRGIHPLDDGDQLKGACKPMARYDTVLAALETLPHFAETA